MAKRSVEQGMQSAWENRESFAPLLLTSLAVDVGLKISYPRPIFFRETSGGDSS